MAQSRSRKFDEIAGVGRALGHPHRVLLLELIVQGGRPVERLAQLASLSTANASQHLQQLKRAGLVESQRSGKQVIYRLKDETVLHLLHAFQNCLEQQRVEIDVDRKERVEIIFREELMRRIRNRSIILLDVRPEDEFAQGRLPGAVNIPIEQLAKRIRELPKHKEVIAYCRGSYCVLSLEAMKLLNATGRRSRQFVEGYSGWRTNGLPIEALV
ncbi:MAG: ArsR family transcriptional regulator [Proteobacteria bacterium]|nr:ArsR family transcriptional regulator [Pseudomonadota bacterium]